MRQCFIISQPRAGSTLLQRLLATHPAIQTIGEPWLALPFVYALRDKGISAEYTHGSLALGFSEFVSSLPGGRTEYFREVRAFLERLQSRITSPGKTYFLDKTPRYHLILGELAEIFPEARFIVLWRNPLAVAASILNTWKKGRFDFHRYEQDVFRGPSNILDFVRGKRAPLITLRYEDLVARPEPELRRMTDFLELSPLPSVALPEDDPLKNASLGDKTGIRKFSSVSVASLDEWTVSFASPLRKFWARRYLEWLGRENLVEMGYEPGELLRALKTSPLSIGQLARDCGTLGWRLACVGKRPPFFRTHAERNDRRRGHS